MLMNIGLWVLRYSNVICCCKLIDMCKSVVPKLVGPEMVTGGPSYVILF